MIMYDLVCSFWMMTFHLLAIPRKQPWHMGGTVDDILRVRPKKTDDVQEKVALKARKDRISGLFWVGDRAVQP